MRKKLHQQQGGLVSITVVMLIMLILSLVIISFARLVRREQRQSLDRQLNTQAFYAAETGVNDALNYLKTSGTQFESANCADFAGPANANLNTTLGDGTSSYSCLLVDTSPNSLSYDSIGTDSSQVVPITPESGVVVDTITIGWEDDSGNRVQTGCASASVSQLPQAWYANCGPAMLRADVVEFSATSTRDELTGTKLGTIFLMPSNSGTTGTTNVAFSDFRGNTNQGRITQVTCHNNNSPRQCMVNITGVNSNKVYLRLKSIYKSSAVTVSAAASTSGTALELTGAQATIDSTGKASDVLRRIQVRVPLFTSDPVADYALESANSICKLLTDTGSIIVAESPSGATTADNSCNPF